MTICMIAHTFSLAYGRSRVVSQNDNGAKKKKKKGLLGDEHRLCVKKPLLKHRLKTIALVTTTAGM